MRITVTRKQRDALREAISLDLNGADELGKALDHGDLAEVRAIRARLRDELALLDDLGWVEDDPRETFELTLAPERLACVLGDLLAHSTGALAEYIVEESGNRMLAERAAVAIRACQDALRDIERHQASQEDSETRAGGRA